MRGGGAGIRGRERGAMFAFFLFAWGEVSIGLLDLGG